MKLFIASDLHGSEYYCIKMLEAFDREGADRLLFLGDLLYHGPRNDLPKDYAPKKVIELMNARKDVMLCVRGNCDADVDQMVLEFPILSDYAVVDLGEKLLFATHGHVWNPDKPLPLKKGDLFIQGHTHVPMCMKKNGILYMNPGSLSIPKENSQHGYMIFEKGAFTWKDLDGTVIQEEKLW